MILIKNVNPVVTTVGTTSDRILPVAYNRRRLGFVVFNNSSNSLYVSFTDPAQVTQCVRIVELYSSWEVYGPSAVWQGELHAIRGAGTGAVTVWEMY